MKNCFIDIQKVASALLVSHWRRIIHTTHQCIYLWKSSCLQRSSLHTTNGTDGMRKRRVLVMDDNMSGEPPWFLCRLQAPTNKGSSYTKCFKFSTAGILFQIICIDFLQIIQILMKTCDLRVRKNTTPNQTQEIEVTLSAHEPHESWWLREIKNGRKHDVHWTISQFCTGT